MYIHCNAYSDHATKSKKYKYFIKNFLKVIGKMITHTIYPRCYTYIHITQKLKFLIVVISFVGGESRNFKFIY